ncbi:MAG: hypothetical protein EZS28_006300 [Streblomastix strix]|uniref:Uncharacterized protein n=1 Tax=Streblomastix strix TaxID=222440 RepID=A0A5J4WSQ4_9EUKA|nr:MAG: hypothetical protein EZS28_006300 [Streblomastix strix]
MIVILFALIASLNADAFDTTISFPRYAFDNTTQILTWDRTKADNVVTVDWNAAPYPFGGPDADKLNVFTKQGVSVTSETLAIKDYVKFPKDTYHRYKYCISECGPYEYREETETHSEDPLQIYPQDKPAFIVGINDVNCYGTVGGEIEQGEETGLVDDHGQCRTNCVNGDPLEQGTYGKALLTYSGYEDVNEDELKLLLAKFDSVSSENEYVLDEQLQFEESVYLPMNQIRFTYSETFPEKIEAYNPIYSDPQEWYTKKKFAVGQKAFIFRSICPRELNIENAAKAETILV